MSTKVLKYISVCLLVLAFGAFGTGVAQAALTANATALTSDGVLTITGNDVSVWSVASAAADDNLTVSVTGATASSLILSSAGTGANAMQITTSAGGLDISVTGTAAGEDLDITTSGATTEMRLTSASTEADAIAIQAVTTTAGIDIDAGTGGIAIDALDAGSINLGASAATASDTSAINIGTSATARTITVGNAASTVLDLNAISVDIDGAATGVTIDALDAGSINLGTSADAASDTSTINIGTSATARTINLGGGSASNFVINGRVATEAASGTEIGLGAAYTYGEGVEMRYGVDSWTGIAGSFKGYYFRTEGNVESASYGLRGMEVYTALDIDTGTAGIQSLTGLYSELLVKAPATSYTIAGYPNALEATFDYEAATAGTTTVTNGVAAIVAKIQTATGLASYTNLDGIRIIGRDADAVRVMGDALAIENDAVGSHATWTNAIAISAGAATGINITGAVTTGLKIAGTTTTDISLQNGETLDNDVDGQFLFSRNTDAGVTIMAADSASPANLTIDTTGAGTITVGSADVTVVTITSAATDAGLVLPNTSVSGAEMVSNTVTETQLAAILTFANADLVSFASVSVTDATEGLILPQHATTCAAATAEGQVCWDVDSNVLYVGDSAAAVAVAGSTGAANTWTDNQIFTLAGDEDIAITHDLAAAANIVSITVTPGASDFATQGIKIDQAASANTNGLDTAIEIDNSDDSAAITAGLLFTSAGGAFTTAINASATQIVTALSVGDNPITGGTWNLNATAALTLGDALTGTNAATVAIFSSDWEIDATGAITGVAFDANGTGNSLSNVDVGDLTADTLTFAAISDSSAVDADTTFTAADGITLTLTPTHTAGDTNFLTIDANQTDDVNATDDFDVLRLDLTSESGDAGDTFDGIVVIWENGTANTIMDSALKIDNAETTVSTMTDAIIVTSSGVDTGITTALNVSDGNIVNAISVGDNIILGGAAVINFTGFDVAATTGATVIAGSAAGTAALTLSLGDLRLVDTDTTTITSVNGTTTVVLIDNAGGVQADNTAALLIDAGGNNASGSNMLRLAPTGTPVEGSVGIEFVGSTKVMQAMNIDGDSVDNSVVLLNGGGALADNKAVLEVTADGTMVAGSSLVRIASTAAAGGATVYGLEISANANNLEGLWVSAGKVVFAEDLTVDTFVAADAYRVTNGTTITASGDLTRANLQAASFFAVNSSAGPNAAVDIDLWEDAAPEAGDVGRVITFAVTTGTGAVTVTVGTNGGTVTTILSDPAKTGIEDPGDLIVCTVISTTYTTCIAYAQD